MSLNLGIPMGVRFVLIINEAGSEPHTSFDLAVMQEVFGFQVEV